MKWRSMLWTTLLTNSTLLVMDKREAFQANNFDLTLSTIGLKCIVLRLPLKIGTPKYVNRRVPILKHNMLAI
jgi:hypothetical protein